MSTIVNKGILVQLGNRIDIFFFIYSGFVEVPQHKFYGFLRKIVCELGSLKNVTSKVKDNSFKGRNCSILEGREPLHWPGQPATEWSRSPAQQTPAYTGPECNVQGRQSTERSSHQSNPWSCLQHH